MTTMTTGKLIVQNPYLDEVEKCFDYRKFPTWWARQQQVGLDFGRSYTARSRCTSEFGFAIPSEALLQRLLAWSPILEVMSGVGYLAWLLRQAGADVIATDLRPAPGNKFSRRQSNWTNILQMDAVEAVEGFGHGRTLLMSWPYMDDVCVKALKAFKGSRFVYIGEGQGGCTAVDEFFEELDSNWPEDETISIPQWDGINDYARFYERAAVTTDGEPEPEKTRKIYLV